MLILPSDIGVGLHLGLALVSRSLLYNWLYAFCMISPFPFQNEVRFIERFLAWRRSGKLFRDYLLE